MGNLVSRTVWLMVFLLASQAVALRNIAKKVDNPSAYLQKLGPLVVMGNASLESANIVFLPEIHDDPESLTTQILLIAREKNKGKPFIVLDESLGAMKKSVWDVFSQKALEIIAASEQRKNGHAYVPKRFEQVLQRLANKYRSSPGQLIHEQTSKLWTLQPFMSMATPFFGWDNVHKGSSLVKRNQKMVETLKTALKSNKRILIMAGARHIPELEYLTSQKLLCDNQAFRDMENYFTTIKNTFGASPKLTQGMGATLPIYDFLKTERYAVAFSKPLYEELDQVVEQFKDKIGRDTCLRLPNK